MDKFTFGETPAAQYLVRVLAQLDDKPFSRSVAKRINSVTAQVNDLVIAYQFGAQAKTVANCLRLMRSELTVDGIERGKSLYALADQLRRNVQIGAIKRGLRLCSIARKAEKVMANPSKRSTERQSQEYPGMSEYYFTDRQSGLRVMAGYSVGDNYIAATQDMDAVGDKTAEMLMQRSDARCKRLKKPHTLPL